MTAVTIGHPSALYGLLLLVPALIFVVARYVAVQKKIDVFSGKGENSQKFRRAVFFRTIFYLCAWVLLVVASAGVSWGVRREPVQKNGTAVAFVFDISYSMTADDGGEGLTRLEAAARYADLMIQHLGHTSVSVILAKGDAMIAVPLTEDTESVRSLLSVLSPELMTVPGSSPGKGIETALRSFPQGREQSDYIWVFTDGGETDGLLDQALADCIKYSVPVSFIGFGSTHPVTVTAGDGKTTVSVPLRSAELKSAAARALKKNGESITGTDGELVRYVGAGENGSAVTLLKQLRQTETDDSGALMRTVSAYEMKPVQRYPLFLILAGILFAAGIVVPEIDSSHTHPHDKRRQLFASVVFLALFLTGCSHSYSEAGTVLSGTWNWHQKKYQQAAACFLKVAADQQTEHEMEQYALYDLAVTYMMQNEDAAAITRLDQISGDAPDEIRYAVFYSRGIIAYRAGDYKQAVSNFREALKLNGTKTDAKINLEISQQQLQLKDSARTQREYIPGDEADGASSSLENAVFQQIRENDKKQWKNSAPHDTERRSDDY